jgi:multidrug efflux system outer membrane protein
MKLCTTIALVALGFGFATTARAQPAPELKDLLQAARQHALPVQTQRANIAVAEANQKVTRGALWPSISANAGYTRNQFDVTVTIPRDTEAPIEATIQPIDQFSATVQVNVPLFDLTTRRQATAALQQTRASRIALASVARNAERDTIAAYYGWLGGQALRSAATASLKAANETLAVAQQRVAAGLATELDLAKARASAARSNRALSESALVINSATRRLRSLTGREISGDAPTLAQLSATTPPTSIANLATLLNQASTVPELQTARASSEAEAANVAANRAAYLPKVEAFARESLTNAAGFANSAQWAVGVTLSWRLDRIAVAKVSAAHANASAARVREKVALQEAEDRINDAYLQAIDNQAAVAAAQAESEAATLTALVTQNRATEGTATLVQVLDARAEELDAQVAVIRARANLAAARALLALEAGQEIP